MFVDGLSPFGTRASVGTVMTNFGSHIYVYMRHIYMVSSEIITSPNNCSASCWKVRFHLRTGTSIFAYFHCVYTTKDIIRLKSVIKLMSSCHYLNQCLAINWTLKKILNWNLDHTTKVWLKWIRLKTSSAHCLPFCSRFTAFTLDMLWYLAMTLSGTLINKITHALIDI